MKTTAIMNLKGGTAKTVTAINTAAILARDYSMRVLLVDADSQANLTELTTRTTPNDLIIGGFADLMRGQKAFPLPTKMKNVDILQADSSLMDMDLTAIKTKKIDIRPLADYLSEKDVRDRYDWCLIDCPPAFSAAAMAALAAADGVIIPMKVDAFAMRGMGNMLNQIRNMKNVNSGLEVLGILPTMFYPSDSQREKLEKLRELATAARLRVFHSIRRSMKVDEMTFAQEALIYSSPKSGATRDYKILVRDLVEDAEGGEADV